MAGLKEGLDNPLVRHLLQLVGVMFFVGVAWAQSQGEITNIKDRQGDNTRAVAEIKSAIIDTQIEAAQLKEKAQNIERRLEEMNKKLDTLIWRTSPYNPDNQKVPN